MSVIKSSLSFFFSFKMTLLFFTFTISVHHQPFLNVSQMLKKNWQLKNKVNIVASCIGLARLYREF